MAVEGTGRGRSRRARSSRSVITLSTLLLMALTLAAWFGYVAGAALGDTQPLPDSRRGGLPVALDLEPSSPSEAARDRTRADLLAAALAKQPGLRLVGGNVAPGDAATRLESPRATLSVELGWHGSGQLPGLTLRYAVPGLPGLDRREVILAGADDGEQTLAERAAARIAALLDKDSVLPPAP